METQRNIMFLSASRPQTPTAVLPSIISNSSPVATQISGIPGVSRAEPNGERR